MNRVEELIQQLCPNGVEWKKLGEVCKIMNGKDYKHLSKGKVPVYGSGGVMTYVDTFVYDKPSVLLPRKGSLNNVFYVDTPFWTVDTAYWTKIDVNILLEKFFYYFVTTQNLAKKNIAAGAVPSLTQEILNKIEIPIPPLPVQQEIVRILDTFTELTANLQTELEARKKQYAYYRDCLLNFEGVDGVEWKKMGEIGTFIRGKRFVRADIVEGGIPCIHYGDVYTFYGLSAVQTKGMLRSDLAAKMRYAHKNDVVIVAAGENKDDIGIGVAWLGKEDAAVHDACFIFRSDMDPNFVSHYLRTNNYHLQIKKYVSEGKICSISADGLGNIMIPIPPLSEQRRIVAILDQFETLVNDQTIGLPAELNARRKQYEYYRDKLLTFNRV